MLGHAPSPSPSFTQPSPLLRFRRSRMEDQAAFFTTLDGCFMIGHAIHSFEQILTAHRDILDTIIDKEWVRTVERHGTDYVVDLKMQLARTIETLNGFPIFYVRTLDDLVFISTHLKRHPVLVVAEETDV